MFNNAYEGFSSLENKAENILAFSGSELDM